MTKTLRRFVLWSSLGPALGLAHSPVMAQSVNKPDSLLPGQGLMQHDFLHTILTNWCPNGIKDTAAWPSSVQLLEITPGKKLVWALRQWSNPDIGPASSIQLLDEPSIKERKGYLKKYK